MFFGIFAGIVAWVMLVEPVLGVRALFAGFRVFQALGLVMVSLCAVSRSRILHTIAVLVTLGRLAGVMLLVRFRAGAFDFPQ